MGSAHSKLSPSGSKQWLGCPASISRVESLKLESTSSSSARLGTFTHYVGERFLEGNPPEVGESLIVEWEKGMEYCTQSMYDEAKRYASYVQELVDRDIDSVLIIEHEVDISWLYPKSYLDANPDGVFTGHADAVVIENGNLHIVDLKTGANLVDAEENSQLKIYGHGTFLDFMLDHDIEKVFLHIYQNNARTGGDRTNHWETTPEYIEDWIKSEAIPKAENALSDNPTCVAGESQCQWCDYKSHCAEAQAYADKLVDDLFDEIDSDELEDMDDKEKTEQLKNVSLDSIIKFVEGFKFLTGLKDAYEQRMFDDLQSGKEVKGYKLVKKQTKRKWKDELEAFEKCKGWLKLDEVAPRKLATPKQIEDALGQMSTKKRNLFEDLVIKPEGQLTIAPLSDKRKAETPLSSEFDDDDDLDFLD